MIYFFQKPVMMWDLYFHDCFFFFVVITYSTSVGFIFFILLVSLTFPPHSWPFILFVCLRSGFQWSNISHLLSLLKTYAFGEFWYVFWIFQMQDILWIFDIRIWMIFIFTAMTKICDLLSSADCIDGEKWATFVFLCIILRLFCAVFLLQSVKFYCYIITVIAELTA